MKYTPNKEKLSCTVCGIDTPETINGTPLCFDCIERMQTGDNSDISERVDVSDLNPVDKTIMGIISKVQEFTGIDDITIKTRKREIVEARQIAHYFAMKLKCGSLAHVGLNIGMKDHATVLHSSNVVDNLYKTDKIFREKYGGLIEYYL